VVATKVIVCPECSQLVAYGRLSCPSCGAMLASVEGAVRQERPTVVPGLREPPKLIPDDAPPPPVTTRASGGPASGGPEKTMRWADEGPFGTAPANAPEAPRWDGGPGGGPRVPAMTPSASLQPGATGIPPVGPEPSRAVEPGRASLLADLPFDAPSGVAGWLVAAGAALGVAGFLLPWAEFMMMAGPGASGYTASWGLAGPGHGFALVACLVMLALAILPNPVPAWIRERSLPPILAGVLIGLVWPYLLGLVQPQIGVLVTAVAGVLMGAGSVISQRPRPASESGRHEGLAPPV
jgi:hypothetical protein